MSIIYTFLAKSAKFLRKVRKAHIVNSLRL